MTRKCLAGTEVRRIRKELGETQAQFAARIGVDPVTVARWEGGARACLGTYALAIEQLDMPSFPFTPAAAAALFSQEKPPMSKKSRWLFLTLEEQQATAQVKIDSIVAVVSVATPQRATQDSYSVVYLQGGQMLEVQENALDIMASVNAFATERWE